MADFTLSDMLQGKAQPSRPLWGDTQWRRDPVGWMIGRGPEWVPFPQQGSQLSEFLQQALTTAPLALRSSAGATKGNRFVQAHQERPQGDITGGAPAAASDPSTPYSSYADSSAGMANHYWHAMRDARTGQPLSNPWPNYRGHVDPIEAMTRDISSRIIRGDLGTPEPLSPYDSAVANQQRTFQSIPGGRRNPPAPVNDN